MKKVVLSLLNYNRSAITNDCLHSLNHLNQHQLDLEVVIIDNASKEELKVDQKIYPKLKLHIIKNVTNSGFAGGHNIGFRYAVEKNSDYVIVLNNDTKVDKELLQELIKAGEENEKIGIIAPKIYFAEGSEYHKDRYTKNEKGKVLWYAGGVIDWENVYWKHRGVDEVDEGQYDREETTEFASGCCFAMKRDVLEKVGMFDERYFLYYEDSDLNERVKRKDYTILYAPKAILWHQNAGSTGGSGSQLQDYFTTRNRLLLGYSYASPRARMALFRESLRVLMSGRVWQKRGIIDFYTRKLGKGRFPL